MDEDIEKLRADFRIADSINSRGFAFNKILLHPKLTWQDLLGCLKYSDITSSEVAVILHNQFKVPIVDCNAIMDVDFWEDILKQRSISANEETGKVVTVWKAKKFKGWQRLFGIKYTKE